MKPWVSAALALAGAIVLQHSVVAAEGDAVRGQRVYRACAPCHSLERDRNMSGPSLAELWKRVAGGLASFPRYSPALKSSRIIWDDSTLDAWIKNPLQFIPGNQMTFPGLRDDQQRADLLAFLKAASEPGHPLATQGQGPGGMMGMMGGGPSPILKKLDPRDRVSAITLCGDMYRVTTADGNSRAFWERNLRFKTDSSKEGPERGQPAILRAGMMGDRGFVIFAVPEEISAFISSKC
jgi:cytochrome c